MRDITNFIKIQPQTVSWLNQEMINNKLFIDNSFQRRYVWVLKDKVKLIETILLGFTIPEIYLWEVDIDEVSGSIKRSIVDGQQRLIAIKEFIDNGYALEDSFLEFKDVEYANKKFEELDIDLRKKIFKYQFSVRMIDCSVSREEIVQVFNRLNCTSYDLTPQELRNAKFNGKFLALSTILANNDFWTKYKFFPGLQRRRMKDVEFASNILMYYRQGIDGELSQESLDDIYKLYEAEYPYMKEDKKLFENTMKTLQEIFCKVSEDKKFINFIRKATHLYSFFTLISYLLDKKLYNEQKEDKIIEFINLYISDVNIYEPDDIRQELINKYKVLSLEGTKSKVNRIERFETLLAYLDT